MIFYLPYLDNETLCYTLSEQEQFSSERLLGNIEWLKNVLGLSNPLVLYVSDLISEWKTDIYKIKDTLWINEAINSVVNVESSAKERTNYDDCSKIVEAQLLKGCSKGDSSLLFLSSSHATTRIVIRSYKELNPDIDISVVCFDAHADIYDLGDTPWKGNVFSMLLKEGLISSVIFIGVPIFRQLSISEGIPESIRKRIIFLDWTATDSEFDSAISEWINLSPSNIFYSFDIDGLDSREAKYTAMEYCSFHVLARLAQKELTSIVDKEELIKILQGCIMQPTESYDDQKSHAYKNLFRIGDDGVPLCDVSRVVSRINSFAKRNHINIGLPLSEGRLIGDIVELFGPDFEGRTAFAVSKIKDILFSGIGFNVKEGFRY